MACLQKKPDERPQSASKLWDMLDSVSLDAQTWWGENMPDAAKSGLTHWEERHAIDRWRRDKTGNRK